MNTLFLALLLLFAGREVRYFPSVLYGHILIGPGASRYETIFEVMAQKESRVTLALFTDRGAPMEAAFLDDHSQFACKGSTFEFILAPERPLKIKLAVPPDEVEDDVAVKSGWGVFHSSEEIEILARVRITTPDGKILKQHTLVAEKTIAGE